MVVDRILQIDSKHCQQDDHYFVFEEVVRDVLLYWSRDDWIPTQLEKLQHSITPPSTDDEEVCYQNYVAPIWGISLYVMPLCYLFADPGEVYLLFRQLYTRYFYKLHYPSNKKGSILYQSILFENLVKQHDMDLYYFLVHELEVQPLEIAFRWMLYAFVGVLESDQVLLMWDRIIGYDSLDLLALTAAALFSFRKEVLMSCQNKQDVFVKNN